jgi:hypothetical protein
VTVRCVGHSWANGSGRRLLGWSRAWASVHAAGLRWPRGPGRGRSSWPGPRV